MSSPQIVLRESVTVVLVACPEPSLLEFINAVLAPSDFHVLTAENGTEAIDIYQAHQQEIDLVLLNLSLPGVEDGLAAFDALRATNPAVRCAVMSDYSTKCPSYVMLRGAVGYIPKPFQGEELVRSVRQWSLATPDVAPRFAGPDNRQNLAKSHYDLGFHLTNDGSVQAAEKALREALELYEELVQDFPAVPDHYQALGKTQSWLGFLLTITGRIHEAEEASRKVLEINEKLTIDFPAILDFRRSLACSQYSLAYQLIATGKFQDAEGAYNKALELYGKLAQEHPAVPDDRQNLGGIQQHLGDLLTTTGRFHEAEEAFQRAVAIYGQLAQEFPGNTCYRICLGDSQKKLGALLITTGRSQEPEDAYRKAVDLYDQLVQDFPDDPIYRHCIAAAQYEIGLARSASGKPVEAERAYRKALEHYEKATQYRPGDPTYQNKIAWVLATCPEQRLREPARAVDLAQDATRLAPKVGTYWTTLGVAHYRAGDWNAALMALEKFIQLRQGGSINDWFFLAMVNWQLGEKDQARTYYDGAVEWTAKHQPHNEELRQFRAEAAALLGLPDHA